MMKPPSKVSAVMRKESWAVTSQLKNCVVAASCEQAHSPLGSPLWLPFLWASLACDLPPPWTAARFEEMSKRKDTYKVVVIEGGCTSMPAKGGGATGLHAR